VGRLDWWNIKAEHTAYEWAAQKAMYAVCPFGERRADMRTAINTLTLLTSQMSPQNRPSDDDLNLILNSLQNYLQCYKTEELEFDADALKKVKPDAGHR